MITLRDVTLRRGVKVVLDRASVTLQPGEKVGLVGRNGAGKSSLFAMLTGRLQPDAGDVEVPARWVADGRVAEVAQEMPEVDTPATRFVLEGDTRLMRAEDQLAAAEASGDGHAIADAHQALADASAFDAPARARALLMGLGFRTDQLDRPVDSFSGGWRMRLQLARALMCPADLMLLDEPTNHLDLDALVWLEAWLKRFEGLLVVISHDREFLDAVTRVTVHVDEARLTRYTGNYTAFEEMRAERMLQQQQQFERQQQRIAHLQSFIDRFKAKATKAKQAQSRVKALDRMERLAPVLASADFAFEFREPASLPNPMLAFDGVACGYPGPAPVRILGGVDRSVLAGQRIGILGANGQGKTTFVKTVAGELPALAGRITHGKGLSIGYFAQQELDLLSPADGPLMHLVRVARDHGPAAREQELRDFLGGFRFTGDAVVQPVGTMSGGEKARLVLAMLVWRRPNLLLLDEPTNHLDLTTREALSIALNEFEGTVMLVSHDRALLREVCDEFWLVTGGRLQPFDGDLDDYQRWLLEASREAARSANRAAAAAPPASASPVTAGPAQGPTAAPVPPAPSAGADVAGNRRDERRQEAQRRQQRADQVKPLKREMTLIDNKLGVLYGERDGLEAELAGGALDSDGIVEHSRRLKQLGDAIETLERRWMELGTQVEAMTADAGPA
jgi:ATP-binding cassette, subfamily F, member 3